jgi:hypothetical protein
VHRRASYSWCERFVPLHRHRVSQTVGNDYFSDMRFRFRFLAALFALVALSAYFAEGVWASMCPPETLSAGAEAPMEQDTNGCPLGISDAPADPSEQSRSDAPVCPLGPLGVGGSCVAASLPATTAQIPPSLPEGSLLSPSPDSARDLLLALAVFHPPRA